MLYARRRWSRRVVVRSRYQCHCYSGIMQLRFYQQQRVCFKFRGNHPAGFVSSPAYRQRVHHTSRTDKWELFALECEHQEISPVVVTASPDLCFIPPHSVTVSSFFRNWRYSNAFMRASVTTKRGNSVLFPPEFAGPDHFGVDGNEKVVADATITAQGSFISMFHEHTILTWPIPRSKTAALARFSTLTLMYNATYRTATRAASLLPSFGHANWTSTGGNLRAVYESLCLSSTWQPPLDAPPFPPPGAELGYAQSPLSPIPLQQAYQYRCSKDSPALSIFSSAATASTVEGILGAEFDS
ncbi:hypothetical protein ARMSODRAFT_1003289 [Armillaria solidipes]|uniref:Uncharacterized protein n=1 Tax=Armillaria solidipes TaxID=1076256 RepID=A0A2H3BIG1_9AGAR|nr:hypothetical protein ARMSODRAFT_1003289 [Armillaria solidipes]